MIGEWRIYYSVHLNTLECEKDETGTQCYFYCNESDKCTADCQDQPDEKCPSIEKIYNWYDVERYHSSVSSEYMTLQVIPDCMDPLVN